MAEENAERYGQLLADTRPGIIDSPEEHERLVAVADTIMDKGEEISPEEEKLLALLTLLIEAYESGFEEDDDEESDDASGEHQPAQPHETIQRLLTARGLELSDISDIFGSPSNAREAIAGRRPISGGQAKQLANYFQVPAKLFRG
jgi:antitoxin component HigA of HigAB toxin-antitoxin module